MSLLRRGCRFVGAVGCGDRCAPPRRRRSAALHALLLASLTLAGAAQAQSSAPGRPLLAAAEQGRVVALGHVTEVAPLDRSAYVATLRIERILAGGRTESLRMAWEELGRPSPPRLAPQDRVLLALEPVPASSLWRRRLPNGEALIIAGRGDAYLRNPTGADVDLLARYLDAAGPAKAGALAELVRGANPALASAALERLAKEDALDPAPARILVAVAGDEGRPLALRRSVIALLGASRNAAVSAELERLARPGSPVEADALIAIGRLNGGLASDRIEALLDRPEPAVRAAGARFATAGLAERRLPALVRTDPSPEARAAAAAALAATRSLWGIDGAVPGLADRDPTVRAATAQALAAVGHPAVPILERIVRAGGPEARGAITALAHAGPSGAAAVRRLATGGGDEALRDYARLALGEGPHSH